MGLDVEYRVEDDHPLDERYLVLDLLATVRVPAEDLEPRGPAVHGRLLVGVHVGVRLGGHVLLVGGLVVQIYPSSGVPGIRTGSPPRSSRRPPCLRPCLRSARRGAPASAVSPASRCGPHASPSAPAPCGG